MAMRRPVDRHGVPLDVLPFARLSGVTAAIGTSTSSKALPANQKVITIWGSTPFFLAFGNNTITVSTADNGFDVAIPANSPVDLVVPADCSHIATIATVAGTLYIAPRA